jgi:hypothetical protein
VHNGKVLTIFSASDYYEEGSNLGAYVKFYKRDMKPLFTRWQVDLVAHHECYPLFLYHVPLFRKFVNLTLISTSSYSYSVVPYLALIP